MSGAEAARLAEVAVADISRIRKANLDRCPGAKGCKPSCRPGQSSDRRQGYAARPRNHRARYGQPAGHGAIEASPGACTRPVAPPSRSAQEDWPKVWSRRPEGAPYPESSIYGWYTDGASGEILLSDRLPADQPACAICAGPGPLRGIRATACPRLSAFSATATGATWRAELAEWPGADTRRIPLHALNAAEHDHSDSMLLGSGGSRPCPSSCGWRRCSVKTLCRQRRLLRDRTEPRRRIRLTLHKCRQLGDPFLGRSSSW